MSGTPTTKAHAAYSASGGGNTYAYTYDCNGNVITRTVGATAYTLTYDVENRLTGVSGGATATGSRRRLPAPRLRILAATMS